MTALASLPFRLAVGHPTAAGTVGLACSPGPEKLSAHSPR
jgi:hypothetical protein